MANIVVPLLCQGFISETKYLAESRHDSNFASPIKKRVMNAEHFRYECVVFCEINERIRFRINRNKKEKTLNGCKSKKSLSRRRAKVVRY